MNFCRRVYLVWLILGATGAFSPTGFILSVRGQSTDERTQHGCPGDTVDRLGSEIAKRSRAFLTELKSAVEASNKTKVASMIRFPLRVATPKKQIEIKNREEFLYNYDHIFTPAVKAKIADEASSRCLFANWQGFMVGDGEVWFREVRPGTFRLVTVNVEADFSVGEPSQDVAQDQ